MKINPKTKTNNLRVDKFAFSISISWLTELKLRCRCASISKLTALRAICLSARNPFRRSSNDRKSVTEINLILLTVSQRQRQTMGQLRKLHLGLHCSGSARHELWCVQKGLSPPPSPGPGQWPEHLRDALGPFVDGARINLGTSIRTR